MAKLLKADKEEIIRCVMKDVFARRERRLKEDNRKLAKRVYRAMFTDSEWELLKKIPKGWLVPRTKVGFYQKGEGFRYFYFDDAIQIPLNIDNSSHWFDELMPEDIKLRYTQLQAREEEIRTQGNALLTKLTALLNPITTTKKLIEVWPEGKKYVENLEVTSNLPALTSTGVVKLMEELMALGDGC